MVNVLPITTLSNQSSVTNSNNYNNEHMFIRVYVYIYIYIHVHTYTPTYVYIYIYIYTQRCIVSRMPKLVGGCCDCGSCCCAGDLTVCLVNALFTCCLFMSGSFVDPVAITRA